MFVVFREFVLENDFFAGTVQIQKVKSKKKIQVTDATQMHSGFRWNVVRITRSERSSKRALVVTANLRCFAFDKSCLLVCVAFRSKVIFSRPSPHHCRLKGLKHSALCTLGGLGNILLFRNVDINCQRFVRAVFRPQQSRQGALVKEILFGMLSSTVNWLRSPSLRRARLTIF